MIDDTAPLKNKITRGRTINDRLYSTFKNKITRGRTINDKLYSTFKKQNYTW